MTRDETIKKRARELVREGVEPEAAMTIAIAEQTEKELADESEQAADQQEVKRLIDEGRQEVDKIKDLRERLERESNDEQ